MKTNYILKTILGIGLLLAPAVALAGNTNQAPAVKTTASQAKPKSDSSKVVKAPKADSEESLEPGEVRLVYPADAINYAVADDTYARKNAQPPVDENEEPDVETPIGQVRKIRDSLEQIRKEQQTTRDLLEDFQGGSERTDEILNAIGRIKMPADRTNDLLGAFEKRFEEVQSDLEKLVDKKFRETNDVIEAQFAETATNLESKFEGVVVDFESKIGKQIADSELKTAELVNQQVEAIKAELASSMETALDAAFDKALNNASEKLEGISFVPRQITFLTIVASASMLAVIVLIFVLVFDKIQSRREKNRLRLKEEAREEAKAELYAELEAKQQQQKQTTDKSVNAASSQTKSSIEG